MQRLFQRRSSRKSARKDILATAPEIRGSMLMGPAALATEEKVLDEKQKLAVPLQQYQPKIYTDEEALKKYLQACSTEPPLAESYGCKDIDQCACVTFERYRRRYFVLYRGVLLYYSHKSHFDRDRKNGFVSYWLHTNLMQCNLQHFGTAIFFRFSSKNNVLAVAIIGVNWENALHSQSSLSEVIFILSVCLAGSHVPHV